MPLTVIAAPPATGRRDAEAVRGPARWRGLYRAGGAAVLLMVGLMLVQIAVYVVWPPPAFDGPVEPWFALLRANRLRGLLSLDLLYLVDVALLVVLYLALYVALRRVGGAALLIGTVLGVVGAAAYYASNTAFDLLALRIRQQTTCPSVHVSRSFCGGSSRMRWTGYS